MLTDAQRAKLHLALLGYLAGAPEFADVAELFAAKTGLGDAERDAEVKKKTLEKKWTAVVRLHSDKRKLQAKLTGLEVEIEAAGGIEAALGGGDDGEGGVAVRSQRGGTTAKNYLLVAPAEKEMEGHRAPVTCVTFHPKFEVLASSGEAGVVKLWNYNSGELERTLKGHTNVVKHIAFDPTGKILASCSSDLTIKLWDFETYQCTKTLRCASSARAPCATGAVMRVMRFRRPAHSPHPPPSTPLRSSISLLLPIHAAATSTPCHASPFSRAGTSSFPAPATRRSACGRQKRGTV